MPFTPADRLPAPEAVEANTDTAWQLFHEIKDNIDRPQFQPTAPASALPVSAAHPYAATQPAGLTHVPKEMPRTAAAKTLAVADVMVEARRNNRLCPKPGIWKQLYEMLPNKKQGKHGWDPQPPLSGAAWTMTPSLAKRMCLRDHIEWAEAQGCLPEIYAFLQSLPETDWHHMDD